MRRHGNFTLILSAILAVSAGSAVASTTTPRARHRPAARVADHGAPPAPHGNGNGPGPNPGGQAAGQSSQALQQAADAAKRAADQAAQQAADAAKKAADQAAQAAQQAADAAKKAQQQAADAAKKAADQAAQAQKQAADAAAKALQQAADAAKKAADAANNASDGSKKADADAAKKAADAAKKAADVAQRAADKANKQAADAVKKAAGNGSSDDTTSTDPGTSTDPVDLTDLTDDDTTDLAVPSALLSAPSLVADALPNAMVPTSTADVVVKATAGQVFVDSGTAAGFVPLTGAVSVPAGSFVDARAGVITLVDKLPDGTTQAASFTGSKFQVRHVEGVTQIVLRGESYSDVCGGVPDTGAGDTPATARAAQAQSKRHVRELWAKDDHGRFQTFGRNSVATVRGTIWETIDRCDGTLVRVAKGKVIVHDRRTGQDVGVPAGHSYLARNAA
jgi:hypothetical protein